MGTFAQSWPGLKCLRWHAGHPNLVWMLDASCFSFICLKAGRFVSWFLAGCFICSWGQICSIIAWHTMMGTIKGLTLKCSCSFQDFVWLTWYAYAFYKLMDCLYSNLTTIMNLHLNVVATMVENTCNLIVIYFFTTDKPKWRCDADAWISETADTHGYVIVLICVVLIPLHGDVPLIKVLVAFQMYLF